MKILLTGAFGNVGTSTLDALSDKGYYIRCFDIPESPHFPKNKKISRKYGDKINVFWGDIINEDDVKAAVHDVDVVLHTAAIIPPLSEKNTTYSELVNVYGTKNIIKAVEESKKKPRLVFTSSVAIYGDARKKEPPLLRVEDPPESDPCDEYTRQKIECERLIRESNTNWSILRLSFVFSPERTELDPLMFRVPLDTLMEPVHSSDVGVALANSVNSKEIILKTLNIAGGEKCRTNYKEFLTKMMDIFGLGMLPDEAFSDDPFHMGYMDTELGQKYLKYQRYGLEDLFDDTRRKKKLLAFLGKITRPIGRRFLLSKSPFYKKNK